MRQPSLFLKCHPRLKDGKEHRYWSICENRRSADGRRFQRQVFYLGEINDSQRAAWVKQIEVFDTDAGRASTMALFAEDQVVPSQVGPTVQIRLKDFELHRPRQWGACWLALELWKTLQMDEFWSQRLEPSREGTPWRLLLTALTVYRLIDPGSEWRLHREWFDASALSDLLGPDFQLGCKENVYRTLDQLSEHKTALFSHLRSRWEDLFDAKFEVLLYDLTSTYFESDPPFPPGDKRRFGYSRDKRSDCVQVVIAVVMTPEGFPIAYEVLAGNTSDKTTLKTMLAKIEDQYGKLQRIWIMDRGIPTEEVLEEMRRSDPPVHYLVGTPKGRLTQLEKKLADVPWVEAREKVQVKLCPQDQELYVLVESQDRLQKERAMRKSRLRRYWKRLGELRKMKDLHVNDLLKKLGAAQAEAGRAHGLVEVQEPQPGQQVNEQTFRYKLNRSKLRQWRRREGRYLLRSNLTAQAPGQLWEMYLRLVEIEAAFRDLKGDLQIRPVFHQKESRVEAHIFVAFLSYCLHVTLRQKLRALAHGLTPRAVLEKFARMQMMDVHFPTTDDRKLMFRRYTKPETDQAILLDQLKLQLPPQAPPQITSAGTLDAPRCTAGAN
jgi:transposase